MPSLSWRKARSADAQQQGLVSHNADTYARVRYGM